jgi:hypothetical protein|uniref:Uncharacterized protein n=1 Tax=Fervidicoccus fontis TaxID=683846 RepID=A0A7C1E2B8_9CREN
MDAIALAIVLTGLSFLFSFVSWLALMKTIKVRITEPYLSGEPERDYSLNIHEPSITLRRIFGKLYDAIYRYIQTGYWGDWFLLSLPFLVVLMIIFIIAYLRGL